jgi:hypothetical protein
MDIYANGTTEIMNATPHRRLPALHVHDREQPDAVARYALELMRCTVMPLLSELHAEKSRPTPVDLARETCDLAEAMFTEMRARGWLIKVPGAAELPQF